MSGHLYENVPVTIWSILVQQPTVPPIPTTTLAPASPTSNFELPPEVLEHLMAPADSPHWWAQPIATLCVGLLAIGSAWLAWCSVNKQITANADDLDRQLVAQRTVYDDGIAEERRRLERAERLEVFRDVVNSAVRVTGCITSLHNSRMLWLRGPVARGRIQVGKPRTTPSKPARLRRGECSSCLD